jgi:hypothetical protein
VGFELSSKGSFKTEAWLQKVMRENIFPQIEEYARRGVAALSAATPVESSASANSWYYEINRKGGGVTIEWRNDHMAGDTGTPVVVLLQYGHGTGTGGYVQGRDFINPAIQPIMDQIAADVWKVVTS